MTAALSSGVEAAVVAAAAVLAGALAALVYRLSRLLGAARRLAGLDPLTGLGNRRAFDESLARETERARRYGRSLALIVLDLDGFKAVNDRSGHLAGDAVLALAGERIREAVRSSDVACRIGGDEFGIVLPESTLEESEQLAERLRAHMSSRPASGAGWLTASAGVAELGAGDDPELLFRRADEALYRAKRAGASLLRAQSEKR